MSLSDKKECNSYITEIRERHDDVDGCKQQLTMKDRQLGIETTGSSPPETEDHVNFLSLLSAVLSDPTTDVKERGAALDILGVITMHDPGLIRKYCIEYHTAFVANKQVVLRPTPNDLGEVIFVCPTDDLMLSLIYVMITEIDSGLSLQTSEIIRIILDTESTDGEQNEEYDFNDGHNLDNGDGSQAAIGAGGGALSNESEQNSFLALFYDRYLHWLIAPFNCLLLVPRFVPPLFSGRENTTDAVAIFGGDNNDSSLSSLLRPIESCPVRASSTLEIISFCVRAHIHRMKFFILRSRLLGVILGTLSQEESQFGVRCLKLASLK
jgi:protein phosphatase-4 regulatory subunit 3